MIEVAGLTKTFGEITALSDVTFAVPEGAVVGLIGPNGAGKSTLIDAVSGFLASYEGAVRLLGQPLENLQAHQRSRAGVRRTWQQTRIAPQALCGFESEVKAE